jgi:transcriptional regulator with XRE-family HTH domain
MLSAFTRGGVVMSFKENLRKCREKKGWTQSQAAQAAGVSFRSYQNWEIGGREPRLDALKKLAEAFGVTADELLEGVTPSGAEKKPAHGLPPAAKGKRGK